MSLGKFHREIGKVGQRLLTIERVVLPGPDADD